ncbi:peptidase S41 [Alphaproteobacteria bacterium]|nr:peptidase S41 [Alphaproteobacteria bacterium]
MKVENPIVAGSYDPVQQKGARGGRAAATVIAIIIALGLGFTLGTRFDDWSAVAPTALNYSSLDEIYQVLRQEYDGEIDADAIIEGAKKGMVEGLGDDYTQYFNQTESQEFYADLEGSFEGIGAELDNRDGKLLIKSVLDDTPAKKSGLLAGDIIARVDDTDTLTWSAESAVQIIRGKAGTKVHLSIIRNGQAMEFDITRAKVTNPSVKYEIRDGVGYLRISRFSDDTSNLARTAAKAFTDAGVRGVVLDLRGNGGGYVSAAVDLASLWLERGETIVVEKFGNTVIDTETASGNNVLKGVSTVVLIDGGTASASEIVAGALADHGAAQLVGTKTFGKGSVQILKPLSSGSQLKVTIAKWYTPKGLNINKEGIGPNIEIEFDSERYKNGTDVQEIKAVEVLNTQK